VLRTSENAGRSRSSQKVTRGKEKKALRLMVSRLKGSGEGGRVLLWGNVVWASPNLGVLLRDSERKGKGLGGFGSRVGEQLTEAGLILPVMHRQMF